MSGAGAGGHHVTVTSSGTFGGRDFGNYTTGTVSGTKYEDPNSDGTLTIRTVPAAAAAWTIKAYTDAATPVFVKSTTTSTTDGTYSMDLEPGSYLIRSEERRVGKESATRRTAYHSINGAGEVRHRATMLTSGW